MEQEKISSNPPRPDQDKEVTAVWDRPLPSGDLPPDIVRPPIKLLDLTTVVKTSQAVSGEIVQAAEENIGQPERDLRLAVDAVPGLVWSALPDGSIDPAIVRGWARGGRANYPRCGRASLIVDSARAPWR
jgi:hypothetical protein